MNKLETSAMYKSFVRKDISLNLMTVTRLMMIAPYIQVLKGGQLTELMITIIMVGGNDSQRVNPSSEEEHHI